jgi:uncharacterized ion transporter superfamily protein YfcC
MLKKKIPHTYVIVFYIIIISAILTWIIPGGEYVEKIIKSDGLEKTEMVFRRVESQPQTWQIFSAIFEGFVRQSGIIVFILMIGGAFWIMNSSKAIDVGILSFLNFTKRFEAKKFFRFFGIDNIVISLIMLLFSVFGAVFGMSEETIAFVIIMVPLAITMGYDSIIGVCMCFVAAALGFAGAVLNPFTIGIAQGLAELPLFSGIEYRMFCWLVINAAGIGFILHYANKVKKKPESSLVYDDDEYWRKKGNTSIESVEYNTSVAAWVTYGIILSGLIIFSVIYPVTEIKIGDPESGTGSSAILPVIPVLTGLFAVSGWLSLRKSAHFFVLSLLGFTILFLITGVMGYDWYIMEIATLFFAMGIFAGIAMNNSPNKITQLFLDGVKDILSAALIVGLAGGIISILENGKIIDTILYGLSQSMKDFGKIASVGIMYLIQTFINIVIPSGSAKAALTMPIMAPFSDLIGVSRQATVMAFQFGDGFTNMITPTSGVLIGVLGVAKIPYDKWVRWVTPFIIMLIILGLILLVPTVTMKLSGF